MHAAAKIKPVVIDESLVDLESLLLCRELGYTGVALKACKGHTEALLMGAAAQKYGMFLCVQDLTCPGCSFLHSASLAARIPTIAAIEGNGRQYCPAGNRGWAERFPTMFHVTDGTLGTGGARWHRAGLLASFHYTNGAYRAFGDAKKPARKRPFRTGSRQVHRRNCRLSTH